MSVRNCIFSTVFCALILGPVVLLCLGVCQVASVPSWLSPEDARWLSGGYEAPHIEEHLSLNGFLDGELQNVLEAELGNNIPAKGTALLLSASLQRRAIEASNALFGWECYPTFFGSNRLYIPEVNALGRMPAKGRDSFAEDTFAFGEELALFAQDYPHTRFNVVLADISEHSALNPASALSSNVFSSLQSHDILLDSCSGSPNIQISFSQAADIADYYRNYYTTDHHWNGFGAALAFASIEGRSLDIESGVEGLSGIKMNGSMSREGLMLLNEQAREPLLDFSSIVVKGIDPPDFLLPNGVQELTQNVKVAEFDFYHGWYGNSVSFEAGGMGEGTALVVCDSFGAALQWFVANDHENTLIRTDLHVSASGNQKLRDIMELSHYDDVYFVSHAGGFAHLLDRFPFYFE